MLFLLQFFQFFSSPPPFISPYHFKVTPFSTVIFCCHVLHLHTSNALFSFQVSVLCGHPLSYGAKLSKTVTWLYNRDYFIFVNNHVGPHLFVLESCILNLIWKCREHCKLMNDSFLPRLASCLSSPSSLSFPFHALVIHLKHEIYKKHKTSWLLVCMFSIPWVY